MEIKEQVLHIPLEDVVSSLEPKERLELLQWVAMDELLVEMIVTSLAENWGTFWDDLDLPLWGCGFSNDFSQKLRLALKDKMPEVARAAIQFLLLKNKTLQTENRSLAKETGQLEAWCRNVYYREDSRIGYRLPKSPPFEYTRSPSREEVQLFIDMFEPEAPPPKEPDTG